MTVLDATAWFWMDNGNGTTSHWTRGAVVGTVIWTEYPAIQISSWFFRITTPLPSWATSSFPGHLIYAGDLDAFGGTAFHSVCTP